MNHVTIATLCLVLLSLTAGLAALVLDIIHRRRELFTQNNNPWDTYDADSKSAEVELKRRVNAVAGREGHPTRCVFRNSVVRKKSPAKVVPMRGKRVGTQSIVVHLQHTKNAYQPSSARQGFGVRQHAVVPTNQTLRELRGCLSGGDEPRNMDKPKRLTNAGTRRGEKTRVSFKPESKPGNSDPETWWVSIATAIRFGRTTFAG